MSNPVLLNHIESEVVFDFTQTGKIMIGGNGNENSSDENSSVANSVREMWKASKPSLETAYKNIGTGVSRASGSLIRLGKEAIDQAGKFNEILSIHEKPEDQLDIEEQLSWICSERNTDEKKVESLFEEAFKNVGSDVKYEGIDLEDLKGKIFRECQKYT